MNVVVTHRKVSGQPLGPDPKQVYGPHWDDTHAVVGLENVDNTSDANKPVSTATAAALALKADSASPTFTGSITAPHFNGNTNAGGTFGSFNSIGTTQSAYAWQVTGNGADQKNWDITATTTQLLFRTLNDASTLATNFMEVTRASGYSLATVNIPTLTATTVTATKNAGGTLGAFNSIGSAQCAYAFQVTGNAADAKNWDITAVSNTLLFRALSDDSTNATAFMTVNRGSGYTVTSVSIPALAVVAANMPALTGDITTSAGSVATTLATVLGSPGTFGNGSTALQLTFDAKGRTTAVAGVTMTPALINITGWGTAVYGAVSTNVGTAGSIVVNGGVLGTPSSGVATNLTGTAAGLTAGNVTTNANLTGPVTSVGNATTIGANQVTRAMQAQGVARSVNGVTGNSTANLADIQGTASQFLGVNSAGTALAFQTMSGDATLSGPAITVTKVNGTDQTTSWTTYTPTITSQSGTFTTAPTATGRYKQIGKTVFCEMDISLNANVNTAAGYLQATLPLTAASFPFVGSAYEYNSSAKSGAAIIESGSTYGSIRTRDASGTTFIANNNKVAVTVVYELP